jgi:hypothetical protein
MNTNELDQITRHGAWAVNYRKNWTCDGHANCRGVLTSDGMAVEYVHDTHCPHYQPDESVPAEQYRESELDESARLAWLAGEPIEVFPNQ